MSAALEQLPIRTSYLAAMSESPLCRRGWELCLYPKLNLLGIRTERQVVFDGFQIQLDGLANIPQGHFFTFPFTDTARKRGNKDREAAVLAGFEYNAEFYTPPMGERLPELSQRKWRDRFMMES